MLGRRRWWPVAAVAVAALTLTLGVVLSSQASPIVARGEAVPGAAGAETLILYDTGENAEIAELYATHTANLVSHFGPWTAKPVVDYEAGEMAGYDAVVYVGSTYDEPLPAALLDDVLAGGTPVLWIRDNLWQLVEHSPTFVEDYGFGWGEYDTSQVEEVRYQGTALTRDPANQAGIADLAVAEPDQVQTLATAVREDGSTFPWAVRSGNLTYVGEIPYTYTGPTDRYLAFTDLLFDVLAPDTPARHRALVRLEDVGPMADPAQLREIADYLHSEQVPFSVAVYPVYQDPQGVFADGEPVTVRLQDKPEVVEALQYMVDRGGTLLMHGYTHQYQDVDNPYDGLSGNDFEFFRAHVDENDHVQLDGPVSEDSAAWTRQRIDAARAEFDAAGLPQPTIFEFPHYAGSATNYRVVAEEFAARYDRGLYFPGLLAGPGGEPDYQHLSGQFVPYPVRDAYGSVVVPENVGEVTLTGFNQHPARAAEQLLDSAERNLVVRDGVASFFYHPFLGVEHLRDMVTGIKELGYEFVPAESMVNP